MILLKIILTAVYLCVNVLGFVREAVVSRIYHSSYS